VEVLLQARNALKRVHIKTYTAVPQGRQLFLQIHVHLLKHFLGFDELLLCLISEQVSLSYEMSLQFALAPLGGSFLKQRDRLGNFGFILLFGGLKGLVMVPGTVIVHQLPPSLGNA